MRSLPHRATMLVATGLLLASCRNDYRAIDPNEGAIHLPKIGQNEQYGQADTATPTPSAEDTEVERLAGARAGDLKVFRKLLSERWANRERHEQLDGVDVKAVVQELAEASGHATNDNQFAIALRHATCQLSDGHLRIHQGPRGEKRLSSGIEVRPASGEFVVTGVDSDHWSAADRKPKIGDVVEQVDGVPVREWADTRCLSPGSSAGHREMLAAGSMGAQRRFADEGAAPMKLTVRRGKKKRYKVRLSWRKATPSTDRPCVESKMIGKKSGLLVLHTFDCQGQDGASGEAIFRRHLDDAVAKISTADKLIVDLRHNPGGDDAQAKAAASQLISGSHDWMRFRHVDAEDPGFSNETLSGSDAVPFDAPMTVLIGPGCASTCEILASVLAQRSDTTLIGQATAGSVGNPQPVELPKSRIVVWVPKTQYALPGTDALIEGRGVQPAVEVMTTAADIRRRRDPVLENALNR